MALKAGDAYLDIAPKLAKGFAADLDKQVSGATDTAAAGAEKKIGGLTKKLATGAVGLLAADKVRDFASAAVGAASDLNEAYNVTGLVFKDARGEIDAFVSSSATSLGLSETAARELTASLGGLLKNMGLSTDETIEWSKKLSVLGADMGSAFNAEPADAIAAIGAGLRGESEPLRRFNVILSDTAVQAEAMRLGLVKADVDATKVASAQLRIEKASKAANAAVKEFGEGSEEARTEQVKLAEAEAALEKALAGSKVELTNAQKTQARLSLITAQTSDVQGDFANTSTGAANASRIQAARMENLKAKIGKGLLPVQQALYGATGDVLSVFEKLTPEQQAMAGKAVVAATALGGLAIVGGKVASGIGSAASGVGKLGRGLGLLKNAEGARGGLAKLADPTLKKVGSMSVSAAKGIGNVVSASARVAAGIAKDTARIAASAARQGAAYAATATRAVASFVATSAAAVASAAATVAAWLVAAAPFILAGAVIAGLAILVVKNFDTIKSWIATAWHFVGEVTGKAIELVKNVVRAGVDFLVNLFLRWTLPGLIITHWDTIKSTFSNAIDAVKRTVSGGIDAVVGFFSGLGQRIARGAGNIFGFLWDSFKAAVNLIVRGWNRLEFKIPGFDPPGPGPKFGGFTLGMPDIPELRAEGGPMRPGRSYLVGEEGPELLRMGALAGRMFPHDELSGALEGSGRSDGIVFEKGAFDIDASDLTADELVDVIGTKLGWKLTTRNDR